MNNLVWITIALQVAIVVMVSIGLWRQSKILNHMTELSPFWQTFQTKVISKLHEEGVESEELELMICQLEALTLTPERKRELKSRLRGISEDPTSPIRDLAQLLLLAMPRVSRERGEPPTPVNGIPVSQLN